MREIQEALSAMSVLDDQAMARTGQTFMHMVTGSGGYFQVLCGDAVLFDSENDSQNEDGKYTVDDGAEGDVYLDTMKEVIQWRVKDYAVRMLAAFVDTEEDDEQNDEQD